jgi:hypothetical protein
MQPIIFLVLCLSPTYTFCQTQPPPPHQKIPGKDPVMIIDKLMPGKSKHYDLKGSMMKFTIGNEENDCKKINVTFNDKPLLRHHCLTKDKKTFDLKLTKKRNVILFNTDRGNSSDSTFASVALSGDDLNYTIKVLCRKNINDTIFISHQ